MAKNSTTGTDFPMIIGCSKKTVEEFYACEEPLYQEVIEASPEEAAYLVGEEEVEGPWTCEILQRRKSGILVENLAEAVEIHVDACSGTLQEFMPRAACNIVDKLDPYIKAHWHLLTPSQLRALELWRYPYAQLRPRG